MDLNQLRVEHQLHQVRHAARREVFRQRAVQPHRKPAVGSAHRAETLRAAERARLLLGRVDLGGGRGAEPRPVDGLAPVGGDHAVVEVLCTRTVR